jgi:nucleoside-diphosphate-sugar epimerase
MRLLIASDPSRIVNNDCTIASIVHREEMLHGQGGRESPKERWKMKILVTGATGYIGSAVSERLARAGHSVTALVHSDASDGKASAAGHATVRGSLADPATVAAAVRERDPDAVVWTATTNDGAVDGPAIAAALAALAGSGKTFLYTSGIWVHGDGGGAVIDETTALAPIALVEWRAGVEEQVLGTAGIRAVILRPAIAYGRAGGIPAMLVEWARRDGLVRVPGDGRNRWTLVHIDDLADLYLRAVERAPSGTALLATGGGAVLNDIARAASQAGGAGGAVEPWPLEQARAALGPFADALALDQRASSARARELLGWQPAGPDIVAELTTGSYAAGRD